MTGMIKSMIFCVLAPCPSTVWYLLLVLLDRMEINCESTIKPIERMIRIK